MKKILLSIFIVVFLSQFVKATVVTQRKIQKQQTQHTTSQVKSLENNIKTCRPYSETMNSNYMGMNINYKIQIKGWENNKCILKFTTQTNGSNSTENSYGVTTYSFLPNITCSFSKEQLEYVGDSILQENERNSGKRNNMLKDPNSIDIPSFNEMSSSDYKLLDVILHQRACTVDNAQELQNMMQEFLSF